MTKPDALHYALGAVLSDYQWRAFCDAWLAVGLAATVVYMMTKTGTTDEKVARAVLSKAVGRVRRKPVKR